jgi:AcrR family transcriptional regulator
MPPLASRRERVLDAATDLFYRSGYYAVSIEKIGEESQTALATIYQLFASKAALLQAILSRGVEGTAFMTSHRLAMSDAPPIDVLADTYIELACGIHGRLLTIRDRDVLFLEPDVQEALRKGQREYVEEWLNALQLARPELGKDENRALVVSTIAFISEVSQIARMQRRQNLEGELRVLASAVLAS